MASTRLAPAHVRSHPFGLRLRHHGSVARHPDSQLVRAWFGLPSARHRGQLARYPDSQLVPIKRNDRHEAPSRGDVVSRVPGWALPSSEHLSLRAPRDADRANGRADRGRGRADGRQPVGIWAPGAEASAGPANVAALSARSLRRPESRPQAVVVPLGWNYRHLAAERGGRPPACSTAAASLRGEATLRTRRVKAGPA